MCFEAKVLELVREYLMDDESAEFFNGSLFIETNMERGHFIDGILTDNAYIVALFKSGDNEVVFDFV